MGQGSPNGLRVAGAAYRRRLLAPIALVAITAALTVAAAPGAASSGPAGGIQKIRHVVVIMQENRSFDSYFGTFPGVDGIPMVNGRSLVCIPDPVGGGCKRLHHDSRDRNGGGPHGAGSARRDVNGGRMNGFLRESEGAKRSCGDPNNPVCRQGAA